jgi:hypothetical protein
MHWQLPRLGSPLFSFVKIALLLEISNDRPRPRPHEQPDLVLQVSTQEIQNAS